MRVGMALAFFLLGCAPWSSAGQLASWRGTLHDANGNSIAGATIILRAVPLSRTMRTRSGAQGGFAFSQVPPTTYSVLVSWRHRTIAGTSKVTFAPGELLLADLELSSDLASLALRAGGTARGASGSSGRTLNSKQVARLPLNGRDFGQLLLLAAGTMTDVNGAANFTQQFAVNGQRGTTTVFAMDGIDITDPELGGATFDNFNVDAIHEIRSSSGVLPAKIGEGAAGFTDIVTKSGTSDIHGDAFEFVRNSAFDARNFFDRRTTASPGRLPHFERNQFGVTNGGAVVLPGLYDGRGRTYYFGEYQGFRQLLGTTQILSVPTVAKRHGVDTTTFPGDTLLVPVSAQIARVLARYPLPNDPTGPFGPRTYATSSPVITNSDQFSLRIDHRISDKAQLFARFSFDDVTGPVTNPSQTAIDASFAIRFFQNERNVGIHCSRTVSPAWTSETMAGFIRSTPLFLSLNTTQPALMFADGIYEPFDSAGGTIDGAYGNLFQLRQDFTNKRGHHTFQMGAETRFNHDTTVFGVTPNGQYTFGGGPAYSPVFIPSASGSHNIAPGSPLPDSLTGFLTATPFSYTASVAHPLFPQGNHIGESAIRRQAYDAYFQDTWSALPALTVVYGLRFELDTPFKEAKHLTSGPVFIGPGGGEVPPWQAGAVEKFLYDPQPPYPKDWGGLGPRLSARWKAGKNTVFNAGAAVTTILPNLFIDDSLSGGIPIVFSPYLTAAPARPLPFTDATLPFTLPPLYTPQGQLVFVSGNSRAVPANTALDLQRFQQDLAASTPGGTTVPLYVLAMSRDFTDGYIGTYTAGVEHKFNDVTLDASYVATVGVKLAALNFPNGYPGAEPSFAPFTLFNAQGNPVSGYGEEALMSNRSHSTYHSLQTSVTKTSVRWGLGFEASYTYSKSLDDASAVIEGIGVATAGTALQTFPQDPRNPGLEKGPSTFDVTHAAAFSVIQNLPFDRWKVLKPLGRLLTTGWEVLDISTFTSGLPFTVYSGIQQTGAGNGGTDRPDQIEQPVPSTSRTVREDYFGRGSSNSSFFSIPINVPGGSGPTSGRFGTLARDTFRGPAFADSDLALIKDPRSAGAVTERH